MPRNSCQDSVSSVSDAMEVSKISTGNFSRVITKSLAGGWSRKNKR